MKIAKGLHRIGSDTVNSYLVVDGGGVTIIDAGLPRYWKLLNSELARLGMTLDDVQALILTHGDTDHIGFAARLHRDNLRSAANWVFGGTPTEDPQVSGLRLAENHETA